MRELVTTEGRKPHELPTCDATDLDDLFYLPPVSEDLVSARDRWAAELLESGTAVLLEVEPGEEPQVPGAHVVYDLLRPLLTRDLEQLTRVPAGATAVWPLIPGLSDSSELWERGCELLAAASVGCLQPLKIALTPADRRQLAEMGDERAFDALFHHEAPSERELSRCAARHGLKFFTPRPKTGRTARGVRNRRLASDLALAGELWLRLGRSISHGQDLLRAARGAESTSLDLVALARENNLAVLDWLNPQARELVAEVAAGTPSGLLASLLDRYLQEEDQD